MNELNLEIRIKGAAFFGFCLFALFLLKGALLPDLVAIFFWAAVGVVTFSFVFQYLIFRRLFKMLLKRGVDKGTMFGFFYILCIFFVLLLFFVTGPYLFQVKEPGTTFIAVSAQLFVTAASAFVATLCERIMYYRYTSS